MYTLLILYMERYMRRRREERDRGTEGERRSKSGGELAERCIACVDELRIKAGVLLRGAQRMQTVQL
jgi:hypothetical protein